MVKDHSDSERSYHGATSRSNLHAGWYLSFINTPRNATVAYQFSDLPEGYRFTHKVRCNFYTHTRYQQVANATNVTIYQAIKATEYIGYMS